MAEDDKASRRARRSLARGAGPSQAGAAAPLPKRAHGDWRQPPAGPIQQPPPRRVQHPLPPTLRRPLAEPASSAEPVRPAEPVRAASPASAQPLAARSDTAASAEPEVRTPAAQRPLHRPIQRPPPPRPIQHPLPASLPRPIAEVPGAIPPSHSPQPSAPPLAPPAAPAPALPRQRRWAAVVVALLVALAAAGTLIIALSGSHSGGSGRPLGSTGRGGSSRPGSAQPRPSSQADLAAAAASRGQAAQWISRQVSRAAIAACDPAMCASLQAAGVPAADLEMLGSSAPDPLGADIVVATPAVRSQFGSRLATVYAPAVLARFGSGAAQIEIRVVAPSGAAAYSTALGQDVAARKGTSAQLLGNTRIHLSSPDRAELAAGQVDSRLLLVLATLAGVHQVRVVAFGDAGPGADPGMPLRSAELAGNDPAGAIKQSSYAAWLRGVLAGQRPPYTAQISTAQVQGQPVVDVQFAAPSPLGLLQGG